MSKIKIECTSCGHTFEAFKPPMICPQCYESGYMVEVKTNTQKATKKSVLGNRLKKLKDVSLEGDIRLISGIAEFDRVVGGGTVNDSVSILTGQPGCGKSTLILEVANAFAEQNKKVLYITSEESESQVKKRAERILNKSIPDQLYIAATKETNEIEGYIEYLKPEVVIVDSISAFRSEDYASVAGSPTQVRAVSELIIQLCKRGERPIAAFIIVHVTKDDELAGSRSLEHDVDSVFYLDSSGDETLRILRATKNRFGEITSGYFKMEEGGMAEITNPSEFFIKDREIDNNMPTGIALSVLKDGNRSLAIEIEALCSYSVTAFPQRVASCLRKDNLNILISILEKCTELKLNNSNVYINVPGGLKLTSPATDLAVVMSIASYIKKVPLKPRTVFIGELCLTGELRKISDCEQRVKELERLGFTDVVIPTGNIKDISKYKIKIHEYQTLKEVYDQFILKGPLI